MMQKLLITIIIPLWFPNLRLVLCQIFSYDSPKTRNFPKIFLKVSKMSAQHNTHLTASRLTYMYISVGVELQLAI